MSKLKIHTTIHKKRHGWVQVKEDSIISFRWPKKYLVLNDTSLDFYRNEDKNEIWLRIPLLHISSCFKNQIKTNCFEIVSRSGSTYVTTKTEQELNMWIDSILAKCPKEGFSTPIGNATHKASLFYDPSKGGLYGKNIPPEWDALLQSSNITYDDITADPTAVIDVLNTYTEMITPSIDKPSKFIAKSSISPQLNHNPTMDYNQVAEPESPPQLINDITKPYSNPNSNANGNSNANADDKFMQPRRAPPAPPGSSSSNSNSNANSDKSFIPARKAPSAPKPTGGNNGGSGSPMKMHQNLKLNTNNVPSSKNNENYSPLDSKQSNNGFSSSNANSRKPQYPQTQAPHQQIQQQHIKAQQQQQQQQQQPQHRPAPPPPSASSSSQQQQQQQQSGQRYIHHSPPNR
ncbi:unnamed protein product [Ambrosiozyma monospora]|uniref:Unnamed protein product n=1 Tax=Ambrosiozyma monospora TaxID=43982 RepID=A0A9W6WEM0_AMBMO|nr:unnamed protein product [Ambrosiozyma monospora]